mmetsp:Transcript_3209/g.3553  ORF Transcript_3209/g.3553 Transcript_3209/m.3553 type:complete len:158 (+) Transcript_3209:93-566(+)
MFGYFPLWFGTYCTLPDRKNKNLVVIANRFNLDIYTPEQADSLVSSIAIGLSNVRQMAMDNTLVENVTCKFGQKLHHNSKKWYTWSFSQQVLYDAYDLVIMADDKTRNQILVISHTSTQTPLFRTSIIGKWHTIDSNNVSLSINDIVCSTQVQHYSS